MKTKEWVMRQFTFVDAVCECNAREAYNFWVKKPRNESIMTNVEFRNVTMQHLVFNKEWQRSQAKDAAYVDSSISPQPECQLKHYAPGVGERDNAPIKSTTVDLKKNVRTKFEPFVTALRR